MPNNINVEVAASSLNAETLLANPNIVVLDTKNKLILSDINIKPDTTIVNNIKASIVPGVTILEYHNGTVLNIYDLNDNLLKQLIAGPNELNPKLSIEESKTALSFGDQVFNTNYEIIGFSELNSTESEYTEKVFNAGQTYSVLVHQLLPPTPTTVYLPDGTITLSWQIEVVDPALKLMEEEDEMVVYFGSKRALEANNFEEAKRQAYPLIDMTTGSYNKLIATDGEYLTLATGTKKLEPGGAYCYNLNYIFEDQALGTASVELIDPDGESTIIFVGSAGDDTFLIDLYGYTVHVTTDTTGSIYSNSAGFTKKILGLSINDDEDLLDTYDVSGNYANVSVPATSEADRRYRHVRYYIIYDTAS